MAFDSHGNLIKLTVTVAPTTPTAGTTFSVSNADAAKLSAQSMVAPFNLVICPSSGVIDPATSEIVRVTAIGASDSGGTGNTQLTITRQTELGGINRTVVVGDIVYYTATKKTLTDIEAAGVTALVTNEVPGGLVNGTNTAFTTAAGFIVGSLRVFLNGVRLKGGGVDYTEGTSVFTMVTAPVTGDVLLVDYNTSTTSFAVGSTNFVINEIPAGTVDGTNTVFTTARGYIAGTTQVYRDGQLLQAGGNDYTETTPASGIITMVAAPVTGSVILVCYQNALSAAGNANTVNGYNANATPTANQIPVLDSTAKVPPQAGGIPTGIILPYSAASAPTGYLICDGTAISRTTFADLFAVIGVSFGSGNGTTTFNLPDLRGRFLRGLDNGAGNDPDRASRTAINTGGNTGDNIGSLEADSMQGHAHNTSWFGSPYAPGLQPTTNNGSIGNGKIASATGTDVGSVNDLAVGAVATDGTNGTPRTGLESRPKNVNIQFIIKT